MAFQASGLFLFEFEKSAFIDKDVVAPNNVIYVRYNVEAFISDARSFNVWNVTRCQDYCMYSNKLPRALQCLSPKMNLIFGPKYGQYTKILMYGSYFESHFVTTFR